MIYVITHKIFDDSIVNKTHYKVLHVGLNKDCKDEYLRDDTLNNISNKNIHYCELTGQYWIWKNGTETPNEITGLVHYRRYFTTHLQDLLYTYFNIKPKILNFTIIKDSLSKYDIILPKRITIYRTVKEFYSDLHDESDLEITRKVIAEIYPEYLSTYDNVMNAHSFYYGNMLICHKHIFDQYSKWLFDIMFELEKHLDLNKEGNTYQARVIGFISERLLQVWVSYNNLKIKEFPVFNTEQKRLTFVKKNLNRAKKIKRLWMNEN
ncbi:DUF4422 domain-containing protein [Bifidobacterium saeculare]|uniref:DUF4422 domain-containing protein n=1 Tax=Bifidobacterium pullorum TaxID=78448 RepID=UPI0018773A3B|nr:DUF4422 domain-containing protein [Bifidobacterium pullorum]MBE5064723.1 DUF4422 domain-containing protein [Bifidobacterium pullorum subsp. saeculare]